MLTTGSYFPDGKYCNASDEEMWDLIEEVRKTSGENWQLHETRRIYKRWFKEPIYSYSYALCVEIGGMLPFQEIMAVKTASECKCYLYGLLSGFKKR